MRIKRYIVVITTFVFILTLTLTVFAETSFITKQAYGIAEYYVDDVQVSKEEYDRLWNNYTGQINQNTYNSLVSMGYQYISSDSLEEVIKNYVVNANGSSKAFFYEGNEIDTISKLFDTYIRINLFNSYKSYYYNEIEMTTQIDNGYICVDLRSEGLAQLKLSDTHNLAVEKKVNEIAGLCNSGSTVDKIQSVYEYLCKNIVYDKTLTKFSPYNALVDKESVCEGYATAFQLIMEELGIESYIVLGIVVGDMHAWNAVNLDGTYYFVDTTFGAKYSGDYKYLLCGTNVRMNATSLSISNGSYSFEKSSSYYEEVSKSAVANSKEGEQLQMSNGSGEIIDTIIDATTFNSYEDSSYQLDSKGEPIGETIDKVNKNITLIIISSILVLIGVVGTGWKFIKRRLKKK